MNALSAFWNGLTARRRIGFVGGLVMIALVVGAIAVLTLRTPYGVLFSGLSEPDLAAMTGELDKLKVPYRVGDDHAQLLVPESAVHKTRLALMSRELPLRGAVGFELFNNVEFGVSEFVQKINFQRALQGELTRTILAIDEVQNARVHLALPEQGLFRKSAQKATASVSIVTKPGSTLQPAQVQGIQRLIAASVPNIQAHDVTVLDQHGVPLSRLASADGSAVDTTSLAALELKTSTEKYLKHKVSEVLDRTFGEGEAVVSVDAVFVQEQSRVTMEEVLPVRGGDPQNAPSGLVVKERQTARESEGAAGAAGTTGALVTSTETEYQVGKRTEQITSPAGAIKRLHVAVVVRQGMSDADRQRVRDIVAATIGIHRERGDVIAVEAVGRSPSTGREPLPETASAKVLQRGVSPADGAVLAPEKTLELVSRGVSPTVVMALAGVLALIALLAAALMWRRRAPEPVQGHRLSEADRARLLLKVQDWLAGGTPPSAR